MEHAIQETEDHYWASASPKYSSTSACFLRASSTPSISSLVGIFGGRRFSVSKNGIYAAAAWACRYVWSESVDLELLVVVAGVSVFDRLVVASSSGGAISASPSSSAVFRFVCLEGGATGSDDRLESGLGSLGIGSSEGRPRVSRRFVYVSSQSKCSQMNFNFGFVGRRVI